VADIGARPPGGLRIESGQDEAGTPVVTVAGELDMMSAGSLREAIAGALQDAPRRLAFELSGLHFIDSAGLAVLIEASSRVEAVELRSPSPAVRRAVELTGLADVLRLVG
jgi:anti-sigma B factor antagonist